MTDDPIDPFLGNAPPPRRFPWRAANLVAAGLVLFLAGAAVQTFRQPSPAQPLDEDAPRFVLLFYDGPLSPAGVPLDDPETIKSWVRELRRRGHYVAGEILAVGALEVARDTTWIAWMPGMSFSPMLSALFVVSAADANEVIAIAQSSPHVQHGGRVIIRPIAKI